MANVLLNLNEQQRLALVASLFQSYNIFTDPDEYYMKMRPMFTYEFRKEHRKIMVEILKQLGWDDPMKDMKE